MPKKSSSENREFLSLRQAALEFRERLRKRAVSVDAVWNAAVYECVDAFGPDCGHSEKECPTCWIRKKLRGVLRLESPASVPLKERMLSSLEHMRRSCALTGSAHASYEQAILDAEKVVDEMMEDFE